MAFKIPKTISADAQKELEKIKEKSGGRVVAEMVVEHAHNPKNPLHRYFTWDDSEAGRLYRLEQARALISVVVKVIPGTKTKVRAYVSLSRERSNYKSIERRERNLPTTGCVDEKTEFRDIEDVMSDAQRRSMLLADAFAELASFKRKYIMLSELSQVFVAIDNLKDNLTA